MKIWEEKFQEISVGVRTG